jgi:hypothetical protein
MRPKKAQARGQGKGGKDKASSYRNSYLAACVAELLDAGDSGDVSGYSDLEDFIVCQPDRDYRQLLSSKYRYRAGSEEEEGGGAR